MITIMISLSLHAFTGLYYRVNFNQFTRKQLVYTIYVKYTVLNINQIFQYIVHAQLLQKIFESRFSRKKKTFLSVPKNFP